MWHPTPEALASAKDRRVLAHLAGCVECCAVVAAARASAASDDVRIRLQNPAKSRRNWAWSSVAACAAGVIVGLFLPVSDSASVPHLRKYLHIDDFSRSAGYILTEGAVRTVERDGRQLSIADATPLPGGWAAISIKLTHPIRIERECLIRMQVATNAGYFLAEIFPSGRDATFLRFSTGTQEISTVTATIRPGDNFGTTLKTGDIIDWITIAAPASESTYMLVHAIELESIP